MSRKILWFVVIVSLLVVGLVTWPSESKTTPAPSAVSNPADVVAAEGRITVKPDHRALLSAEVAGRIQEISVDNLAPVKKGQVLAVLYNADTQQKLEQMRQAYQRSQQNYLELAHGTRAEDVAEANAEVHRAEADLDLARQNE